MSSPASSSSPSSNLNLNHGLTQPNLSPTPHLPALPPQSRRTPRSCPLAVLFFHFSIPTFAGGFLGVDVFLTLSGFLITRNLLPTLPTFSFRSFYLRRFWRLYPSSLFTVFITAIAAFLCFPEDLAQATARSALAALSLIANIHFYDQADYFEGAPDLKPLLHVWSLALEEQFYILWPCLLYLLYPRKPNLLPLAIAAAAALSFATASTLHPKHLSFVFYLLPCRVYQFAAGALIAVIQSRREPLSTKPLSPVSFFARAAVEAQSAVALFVIIASFILATSHISPVQMLPLVASVCVLIATPDSFVVNVLLGNRLSRAVGRASYSAYLVHWPIVVFMQYVSKGLRRSAPSPLLLTAITIFFTLVLHHAVEKPMRTGRSRYFIPIALTLLATLLFCAVGIWTDGWSFRLEGTAVPVSGQRVSYDYRKLCQERDNVRQVPFLNNYSNGCIVGKQHGTDSKIVVIGDSFARHLIPLWDKLGKQRGLQIRLNFFTNCSMLAKSDTFRLQKSTVCQGFHDRRWKLIDGIPVTDVSPFPANSTFFVSNFGGFSSFEARRKRLTMLHADITAAGHNMVLIGETPGVAEAESWRFACLDIERSPLLQMLKAAQNSSSCVSPWLKPKWSTKKNSEEYESVFENDLAGVPFIDMFKSLCKEEDQGVVKCKRLAHDTDVTDLGYVRDGYHLTIVGSEFLSDIVGGYVAS